MILTSQDAVDVLGYNAVGELPPRVSSILLPAIDGFIEEATGLDYGIITASYTKIDPTAKLLASMLLVNWFENPSMMGKTNELPYGITSLLTQLQAKALSG